MIECVLNSYNIQVLCEGVEIMKIWQLQEGKVYKYGMFLFKIEGDKIFYLYDSTWLELPSENYEDYEEV